MATQLRNLSLDEIVRIGFDYCIITQVSALQQQLPFNDDRKQWYRPVAELIDFHKFVQRLTEDMDGGQTAIDVCDIITYASDKLDCIEYDYDEFTSIVCSVISSTYFDENKCEGADQHITMTFTKNKGISYERLADNNEAPYGQD